MRRSRAALTVNLLITVALATATVVTWPQQGAERAVSAPQRGGGKALFAAKGCAACHVGPDGNGDGITGVGLANVQSRVAGMGRDEYIRESIERPGAYVLPGNAGSFAMPVLALSDGDVEQLVDYLLAGT